MGVVQELAASVRRQELQSRFVDQKDDELLWRFFLPPAAPVPAVQSILSDADLLTAAVTGSSLLGKRGISQDLILPLSRRFLGGLTSRRWRLLNVYKGVMWDRPRNRF